jgi:hypothetical protein
MNVADEAQEWCEKNGENLSGILLRCFFCGWIFRCSDFLLLAEEVLAYPGKGVVGMGEAIPKNCWFVYYLGHTRGVYTPYDYQAYAPYPQKYVAWKRRNRIYVQEWTKLRRDFNSRLPRKLMNIERMG